MLVWFRLSICCNTNLLFLTNDVIDISSTIFKWSMINHYSIVTVCQNVNFMTSNEYNIIISFIFRFITDSLNALVGLIIFVILVVLRKKVISGLANRTFLGSCIKFPTSWKKVQDSECEEIEEEDIISMTRVEDS